MLFASLDFLLFFVPVLAAAWLLHARPRAQLGLLLAASYFFYMASARPPAGESSPPWTFAGLLLISTILDFTAGLRIHAASEAEARGRRIRNAWLAASLTGNLGLLAYFKYVDFLREAFVAVCALILPGELGWSLGPALAPILPIGISFYTFQSLSYTIDVWRGRLSPERSLARFALFVAFFPQLVAGPIVRAQELLPQLHRRAPPSAAAVEWGLARIFTGLAKKVVLGDFIAVYFTDIVFDAPGDFTSVENLLALYAFTLQIYADFSGYSDIAIGVARLLGFEVPENFDRPYQARDIGEFWRRWHMTLSTWLRDYLFFPLGGSRGSKARTYFNLWLTMFLVGMWHGASWNFVIYSNLQAGAMVFNRWNRLRLDTASWLARAGRLLALAGFAGLVYGFGLWALELDATLARRLSVFAALVALVVVLAPRPAAPDQAGGRGAWAWRAFHVALTFHFATLTRVFFRAEDLDRARSMIARLLELDGAGVRPGLFRIQALGDALRERADPQARWFGLADGLVDHGLLILLVVGTAYHFTPREWADARRRRFAALPGPVIGILFAALSVLIMHLLDGPRPNIYFAF